MADEERPLSEILRDRRRAIDDVVDDAQTGASSTGKKKKPKKQKPVSGKPREAISTGRDLAKETESALMVQLRARREAAQRAGNVDMVASIDARMKALKDSGASQ